MTKILDLRTIRTTALIAVMALLATLPGAVGAEASVLCNGLPVTIDGSVTNKGVNSKGFTVIRGTRGDDVILGTTGDDRIMGGLGNDTICALEGNDLLGGGAGNDHLEGGPGDNILIDMSGNDTLIGGDDTDRFLVRSGSVTVDGAGGSDRFEVRSGTGGMVLNLATGHGTIATADGLGTMATLSVAGIERVRGTQSDDRLTGDAERNVLDGRGGADVIKGGEGGDNINGGPDDDEIHGGGGRDAIFGADGNDTITGDDGNDTLEGQDGDDTIDGGEGNDLVRGRDGDDHLVGGPGINEVAGNAGTDYCIEGPDFRGCEGPDGNAVLVNPPAGMEAALDAFMMWLGNNANPEPNMPQGLIDHLTGTGAIGLPMEFRFEFSSSVVKGDRIAVAQSGDDIVLLAQENAKTAPTWEILGADMPSLHRGAWYGEGPRYALIVGSDGRPGENPYAQQADSIHVLAASPEGHAGAIVGVPRDTIVDVPYDVPGLPPGSPDKINSTMRGYNGGVPMTLQVVQDLTGLPIEGYIATQFGGGSSDGPGFRDLIDALGGLSIDLPSPVTIFGTVLPYLVLPPGQQVLDGDFALQLARERKAQPRGDFDRKYHGALILQAVLIQAQGFEALGLPLVLDLMETFVKTDLQGTELLTLAFAGMELDPTDVVPMTAPGYVRGQDLDSGGKCFPPPEGTCVNARSGVWLGEAGIAGTPEPQDAGIPTDAEAIWRDLDDGVFGNS